MKEISIVRENLMENRNYRPYCGENRFGKCYNPRTEWTGEQFICPHCKWRSQFPKDFIDKYKAKHELK